jgi:nitrous oxidase accessory protein NosD
MNYLSQNLLQNVRLGIAGRLAAASLIVIVASATPVYAGSPTHIQPLSLCVDQNGKPGCYTHIQDAVVAAGPGDTVVVDDGTYYEDVVINKPLTLIGTGDDKTIIDATGKSNGIYIDGFDNPNLADVIVRGFKIQKATFEGILVNNAADITIWHNHLIGNDQGVVNPGEVCLGLPAFETDEATNCGDAIHLMGTVHSVVASNLIELNSGGVMISDETNTSHDNLIEHNIVKDNCHGDGITLASKPPYPLPGGATGDLANDIYNNIVRENDVTNSGYLSNIAGVGISIDAPKAGNRTFANSILGNRVWGNTLAGITIHDESLATTTAKAPDASRNTIVGNFISGNGPDLVTPTTVPTGIAISGSSPIIDTMVSNNFIEKEGIGVAFQSFSQLEIHLNDFAGNPIGIANIGGEGTVNARDNWWGCTGGPGATGCSISYGPLVIYTPWLTRPVDGALGHGLDKYFDFLHSWDCDKHSGLFESGHGW